MGRIRREIDMYDGNSKPAPRYVRKGGGYITHIAVGAKVLCGEKYSSVRGRFRTQATAGFRMCKECEAEANR